MLARAREKGLDPADLAALGRATGCRSAYVVAASFLQQYLTVLDDQSAVDYADLIRARGRSGRAPPRRAARPLRPRLRRRVPGHRPQPGRPAPARWPATAATSWSSATPTSRSTASAAPTSAASSTSRRRSRPPTGEPAPVVALGTTRRFGSRLLRPPSRSPPRSALSGAIAPRPLRGLPLARAPAPAESATAGSRSRRSTPPGPRPSTSPTCCAARTSRTASPGREMAVLVRSGRSTHPARCAGRWPRPGVPVEVASDETPLVREPAVLPLLAALRVVVDAGVDDPDRPRTSWPPTASRRC